MKIHKYISISILCLTLFLLTTISFAQNTSPSWHAGTWDSSYYVLGDHPKTIAIRMELLDKDTHIPVKDVQVLLEGEYYQMWISQDIAIAQNVSWWNLFVDPEKREPQPKEFKMDAVSDSKGVVVFTLQWQKEYPWDSYFDGYPPRDYKPNGSWTQKSEWSLALDDIEKVQRLEIRHPQYRYIEAPLDFKHIVSLEQYLSTKRVVSDRNKLFEQNWKNEISRSNVKMFVLEFGSGFKDYQNKSSTREELFQKIHDKDYGTVYKNIDNLPNLGEGDKSGPYFMYDLGEILLEPIASRISVEGVSNSIITSGTSGGSKPWYEQYSQKSDVANTSTSQSSNQKQDKSSQTITTSTNRQPTNTATSQGKQTSESDYIAIAKNDPFGIAVTDLKKERAESLGLSPVVSINFAATQGFIIEYVTPGSLAQKAGLAKDCILTHMYIDDYEKPLTDGKDYEEACNLIRQKKADVINIRLSYWQFPAKFNGQIDYAKYLKETKIRLTPNIIQDNKVSSNVTNIVTRDSSKSESTKTIQLGNGVTMEFVLIPAGSFYMGSPDSEKDRNSSEGPIRRVQITKSFYMGKLEVTQDQYMAVIGSNPSKFSGRNLPVECVSLNDAVSFCRKIGARLPTEAEWEYSCRAGTEASHSFGDSDTLLGDYAWYSSNSGSTTHSVGQKKPNAFGLYDMYGNVWEWCSDWYADSYRNLSTVDPTGPSSGQYRVYRGGAYYNDNWYCRSASRGWGSPVKRVLNAGFRVVLDFN
jgi:formylglycine-generating enzyme required for sulfatase activity